MRLKYRRFLCFVLLASYAGHSLLGEGLHWLTPEAGRHCHCHHHRSTFAAKTLGRCSLANHQNCHTHRHAPTSGANSITNVASESPVLVNGDDRIDPLACKICAFLYQALGQTAEISAPLEWQPCVSSTGVLRHHIRSLASLGPQAPRGPPCAV